MDHLDIPKDCGTHQICDDLPRVCNVSKEDFEFVMRVDMHRLRLRSYGWLPVCTFLLCSCLFVIHKCIAFNNFLYLKCQFRAITPYSTPPSTTEHPMADEVHVHSFATSLNDWLHSSGSSSQNAQKGIFRLVQYRCSKLICLLQ
jgi:hypothetical protein